MGQAKRRREALGAAYGKPGNSAHRPPLELETLGPEYVGAFDEMELLAQVSDARAHIDFLHAKAGDEECDVIALQIWNRDGEEDTIAMPLRTDGTILREPRWSEDLQAIKEHLSRVDPEVQAQRDLAAEWDAQLREAYDRLEVMKTAGLRPELQHQGVGDSGPVRLVLDIHPDKGPSIEILRPDGQSLGWWFAPGHQYNPLPVDGICWPSFLDRC